MDASIREAANLRTSLESDSIDRKSMFTYTVRSYKAMPGAYYHHKVP